MLTLDGARDLVGARVRPLPSEELSLGEAGGLRLADSPVADVDLPPADVSAMDGYAVRAGEVDGTRVFPVAMVAPAGTVPPPLHPGSVARIFTGAPLPAGADAVVCQEVVEVLADGTVRPAAVRVGADVRRKGEIFAAGTALARERDVLTPQRVSLLASGGSTRVRAFPRPRVGIVVTGEELVDGAARPGPGQIRNSNGPMLAALAREAALLPTSSAQVGDTLPALRACLERAARTADLLVSSGGVSVGDFDLVPRAVVELGGEVVLHKVTVRPGKPVLVARLGAVWLVGLPGNPVSALVCWRMFARPLAEALAGSPAAFAEPPVVATLSAPARNRGDRTLLRPAVLAPGPDGVSAAVLSWHGSHDVIASSATNALARLEVGAELPTGARVPCYPLPWRWLE